MTPTSIEQRAANDHSSITLAHRDQQPLGPKHRATAPPRPLRPHLPMADTPREWDVDRVRQWAEETFAFGATLAPRLVENEVDGGVLLDWMDEERLKNDIGIRPLGQRVKILEKIAELAGRSPAYCVLTSEGSSRQADRRISYPLPAPPLHLPQYSNLDTLRRRQTIHFLPSSASLADVTLTPFPQNLNPNFNEPQSFSLESSQSGTLFVRNVTGTPSSIASRFRAIPVSSSWPTTPMTPVPRRIALNHVLPTQPARAPDTPVSLNSNVALDDVDMEEPAPSRKTLLLKLQSAKDKAPKPVEQPAESTPKRPLVASLVLSHVPKKRKITHTPVSFFRFSEFKACDVFFPAGQESDDSDDFVVYNPIERPPLGERIYVQKLMKRALVDRYDTTLIHFARDTVRRTVWTPYSDHYLAKHQPHVVLVFDVDETGACRVYQAPRDTLGVPEKELSKRKHRKDTQSVVRFGWDEDKLEDNPFTAAAAEDDWSFLEKWNHMDNDELLPEFGESDDEEAAYDDATMREMEEEANQRAGITKVIMMPLDVETIRQIIDEEIEKFEVAWGDKELPKVEKQAWRFYQQEKRLRRRSKTVAKFKEEFAHVNERVEELKAEYEKVEWRNARDLRSRCGNLELSIYELKRLQWNIKMLMGYPPHKPAFIEEEENKDEDEMDVEVTQVLDVEAVVEEEGGEEEDEDDLDEMDDEDDEDEGDDLDGFIIDDGDVGQEYDVEMDDLDDPLDADYEQDVLEPNDAITDSIIGSSPKSPRRSKRLRRVLDESEMEEDAAPQIDEIVEAAEEPLEREHTPTTMPRSSKGKEPMDSQSTSLPTPPQEDDLFIIKDEPVPRPDTAGSVETLDGYDSDIFVCFGDQEISKFVEATQAGRDVARDYLLRADGKMERAVAFYYDNLANGLAPDKSRKRKKKGKETERTVIDLAADEPLANIFKPSFAAVLPKPRRYLREFLSNIVPQDLHQTLIEISELPDIDPTTAFLEGVTVEDCERYWSLYRAYLFDLFGKVVDTLETEMGEQLRKPAEFQKFYHGLSTLLNVEPPAPSSSKRRLSSQEVPPDDLHEVEPSSQPPVSDPASPEMSKKTDKGKGVHKSKSNISAKPITKSLEEISQDKEMKRIADREKLQKKKGTYITKTAEGAILINPGKKASDDAVTFHPRLAKVMKPHQIEGAQFIWKHVSPPVDAISNAQRPANDLGNLNAA